MPRRVAIVGTGMTRFVTKRLDVSTPELVREAVQMALGDADLQLRDVDAVVLGLAPEAFEGVNQAEKWVAPAAGALGKAFMRIHTGGATGASAAQAGAWHVASGHFDIVLVVALQRVGESPQAQNVLNTIWDPILERDFGLNTISMVALQATQQMHKYGCTLEHFAMVAVKNRENAARNPWAHLRKPVTLEEVMESPFLYWPLRRLDCCPRSDGACAVIFASGDKARRITRRPAWIRGMAAATDTYFIGDRLGRSGGDYCDMLALRLACQEAYRQAGITDPARELDVIECYSPFSNMEIACYEAMGLCEPGQGHRLLETGFTWMDGPVPVTPSGGVMASNPIGATALVRVAEAARQVMGKAEGYQVPGAKVALATGAGGSAQFFAAMVLSGEP